MSALISVVSHGHAHMLTDGRLNRIINSENVKLVVLDNLGEENLREYCERNNITYMQNVRRQGFGANNNKVFAQNEGCYFKYFICINPDIILDTEALSTFIKFIVTQDDILATLKLVDTKRNRLDQNIRRYPTIKLLFRSLFLSDKTGYVYDENERKNLTQVDWCCGSFLAVKSEVYQEVSGFDERYFMYMEDVDLCRTISLKFQTKVKYYDNLVAEHPVALQNRKIYSQHFLMHIKAMLLYFYKWGLR